MDAVIVANFFPFPDHSFGNQNHFSSLVKPVFKYGRSFKLFVFLVQPPAFWA
jgi:hypothetical protein